MVTMLRRLFWMGVLGGAGYAGWLFWQQRDGDEPAPEWPPLDPPSTDTIVASVPTAEPPLPTTQPSPDVSDDTLDDVADDVPNDTPDDVPNDTVASGASPSAPPVNPPMPVPPVARGGSADEDRMTLAEAMADGDDPAPLRWVDPVDGGCPAGYPIKANDKSGIYHTPGGTFYDRTVPERCYADADDAEADGYRAARS